MQSNFPIFAAHSPDGAACKQVFHYTQLGNKPVFRQYDHGIEKNIKEYGQVTPPEYNLKNVKAPVYLYHGPNDALGAIPDVHILKGKLGNVMKVFKIPYPLFNHMDFLMAVDVDKYLYKTLLPDMKKASQNYLKGK